VTLRPFILLAALLAVVLAGCATMPGGRSTIDREMAATAAEPVKLPKPAVNEEAPIKIKTEDKARTEAKPEVEQGTGQFINEEAAKKPGSNVVSEEGQITFNFENQPIQAVVQAILGSLLKENYTIAPTVTGNVTFSTAKPITPAQAMPILEMLLSWTNNTLVVKEGRYEVVPIKDAIPGNLTPRIAPPQLAKGYEVRVFPLKYIAPKEMQKLLKPYAKADAFVSYDDARNFIIMAGTGSELANYQRTIEVFDVDWLKGMSVGVYALRNTDVSKVMPDLDKVFGATGESPLAGMFRFIPMDTTNSIVVITSQPEYLKQAETWLYRLDAGVGENGTQLYVYDVKNVKAVELSDHLNAIFTGQVSQKASGGNVAPGLKPVTIGGLGGGVGGGGKGTNSAMSVQSQRQQNTPQTPGGTGNVSTTGTGTPTAAGGQKPTDIRITPIEENNQLLVMATPGEWDSILAAIHRLDISPLQVQIETKILEVSLSGDLEFGVQWYLAGLIGSAQDSAEAANNYRYTYPPSPTAPPDFVGNIHDRHRASLGANGSVKPPNDGGLFYSFLNKNMEVALHALQKDGVAKALSAPSMVVMNNQQATINVGQQVPINSTSFVGLGTGTTTGGTNTTGTTPLSTGISSAQYVNTGVILDVKPRVNPGGLVYMDISQEVSSPGTPASEGANPPINQRQLQTQIAVQSGETILLGGLIQEHDITSKSGLPLLSNVPLLGNLFGSTSKTRDRTELIVLITPRVITNQDEAHEMTQEYEQKFESLAPLHAKPAAAQPVAAPAQPAPAPPAPTPEPAAAEPAKP
jgi:general secretion pathway protein D